ncbi:hypothetical protein [Aerococcus urinae]|uniref:Uncharacterized protein n=1 Tax=Aerococcus urinae TaxID=1376 RepID=A0A0X8FES8_9LACT|nr:hypothetical protein [Aerococcus urinae]AMB95987.1 hypothetical protein AWM73_05450 [Aerococcus urinae]MCY3033070.1 hypothetical protein [Aerococcus urinae]MCY3038214.1 hypothetical protein [Aerococcus urinae]MCY3045116.1 hypothetical protein [Aerococcus urinae]MCY3048571.1 hypothetical protein [Aerococcus urinae]
MRKVEAIYPIVKTFFNDVTFNDNGYIFTVAYPKLLKNNKYFEETFFQIYRNVMLLFINEGYLFINKNDPLDRDWEIMLPDAVSGEYRRAKIIKKMISVRHVYEIRMDTAYQHLRFLFFPCDNQSLEKDPNLIFCYSYIKEKGRSDPTQPLTEYTQKLRDHVYDINNNEIIIGEEFTI